MKSYVMAFSADGTNALVTSKENWEKDERYRLDTDGVPFPKVIHFEAVDWEAAKELYEKQLSKYDDEITD